MSLPVALDSQGAVFCTMAIEHSLSPHSPCQKKPQLQAASVARHNMQEHMPRSPNRTLSKRQHHSRGLRSSATWLFELKLGHSASKCLPKIPGEIFMLELGSQPSPQAFATERITPAENCPPLYPPPPPLPTNLPVKARLCFRSEGFHLFSIRKTLTSTRRMVCGNLTRDLLV